MSHGATFSTRSRGSRSHRIFDSGLTRLESRMLPSWNFTANNAFSNSDPTGTPPHRCRCCADPHPRRRLSGCRTPPDLRLQGLPRWSTPGSSRRSRCVVRSPPAHADRRDVLLGPDRGAVGVALVAEGGDIPEAMRVDGRLVDPVLLGGRDPGSGRSRGRQPPCRGSRRPPRTARRPAGRRRSRNHAPAEAAGTSQARRTGREDGCSERVGVVAKLARRGGGHRVVLLDLDAVATDEVGVTRGGDVALDELALPVGLARSNLELLDERRPGG
jgi:hypothetical protein